MSNVAHLPQEPLWMCLPLSFMQLCVCVRVRACVCGDWSISKVGKQNVYSFILMSAVLLKLSLLHSWSNPTVTCEDFLGFTPHLLVFLLFFFPFFNFLSPSCTPHSFYALCFWVHSFCTSLSHSSSPLISSFLYWPSLHLSL